MIEVLPYTSELQTKFNYEFKDLNESNEAEFLPKQTTAFPPISKKDNKDVIISYHIVALLSEKVCFQMINHSIFYPLPFDRL